MPLKNVGLLVKEGSPIVGYSGTITIYRPMQFMIKFAVDRKTEVSMQKMYLQQIITPFHGGHYTPIRGFNYLVNVKKAVGIQRTLVNLDNVEEEIRGLTEEANRFMYMYCRTDVI